MHSTQLNKALLIRRKIMRVLLAILAVCVMALILVKKREMTYKQSLLRAFYPVIMAAGKMFPSKKAIQENKHNAIPATSFYTLKAIANNGDTVDFSQFKGQKVLLVNTASDCGYTRQYEELEKLYQQFGGKLVIMGFPSNDFKEQEKAGDDTIANFCKRNYGITFLLAKKSEVIKGTGQNPVFTWLSDASQNGWCSQEPVWNFSKYLVNEDGVLTHFFAQTVSPMDKPVLNALH